jgi:hypothetical protein
MKVEQTPEVERRIRLALRKAGRREIGGMLMAEQLSPDHFRIVDFSVDGFSAETRRFIERRSMISSTAPVGITSASTILANGTLTLRSP